MRNLRPYISRAWWRALGAVGLPKERWDALDPVVRRAVVTGVWLLIGLALVALEGEWNWTAIVAALVVFVLVVPPWRRLLPRRLGRWVVPAALLLLAVFYPNYLTPNGDWPGLFGWPIFGPFPAMDTMVVMMIFTMMAIGLNIVVGYAGLLDLGYVAFYAIGAYMAGWFASSQFAQHKVHFGSVGVTHELPGFHISIWLVLVMAGVVTAVIGVVIGLPTLRLRGDYLAIVTLGFGEIIPQIARNGDNLFGTGFNLTGGTQGLTPIDGPGFGTWLHDNLGLPENYLTAANSINLFYWTALILVLFTIFCSIRLRDSRLGRAWIAIREDETAAAAMGVPLMRTKTWAYATGAFFGGIAGAYYASFKSATFPDDFIFNISVFILCMVILGGMGNIAGVAFGAMFLAYLDREGLANVGHWLNTNALPCSSGEAPGGGEVISNGCVDVPLIEFGIFGVILVVVMLFRPEGLIPSGRRKAEFHEGVADQPLYDATH